MDERLILDTGVLVAAERGQLDFAATAGDETDVAVPTIVVAEYLTGVRLARTNRQRETRRAFLDRILDVVPVEDYTRAVAECHADLLAHARRAGTTRGAHDLIVAATAIATRRTILTTDDDARFADLPGASARLVTAAG